MIGLGSDKKVLTSSASTLAYVLIDFEVFQPISNRLLGKTSNLLYFPSPGGLPFLTVNLTAKVARLKYNRAPRSNPSESKSKEIVPA